MAAQLRAGNEYLDTVRICDQGTTDCGDVTRIASAR
jgi:hypothetical protein